MFNDLFKNYTESKAEVLASSYFINDGKGNFTRFDLPDELQQAPVMSFVNASSAGTGEQFIGAGNFYGVIPYEGRYDALIPSVFTANKSKAVQPAFPFVSGEVRDMKWANTAGKGKVLIVARNNSPLLFFKDNGLKN